MPPLRVERLARGSIEAGAVVAVTGRGGLRFRVGEICSVERRGHRAPPGRQVPLVGELHIDARDGSHRDVDVGSGYPTAVRYRGSEQRTDAGAPDVAAERRVSGRETLVQCGREGND